MTKTRMLDELVNPTGILDIEAWTAAHRDRTQVAKHACGGPMLTDPTEPVYREHFGVRWFTARCLSCQETVEMPGTRKLQTEGYRPSRAGTQATLEYDRRRLAEAL